MFLKSTPYNTEVKQTRNVTYHQKKGERKGREPNFIYIRDVFHKPSYTF